MSSRLSVIMSLDYGGPGLDWGNTCMIWTSSLTTQSDVIGGHFRTWTPLVKTWKDFIGGHLTDLWTHTTEYHWCTFLRLGRLNSKQGMVSLMYILRPGLHYSKHGMYNSLNLDV